MNTERLLKLADHLGSVHEMEFDMEVWSVDRGCGTVACAVGHACSIPSFRAAGLTLSSVDSSRSEPVFYGLCGMYAVMKFFGLSMVGAHYLFTLDSYNGSPKPEEVAERIRNFVAEQTA